MDKIAVSVLGKEHKAALINKLITKGFQTIHYDVMDGIFVKNIALQKQEMEYIFANTNKHIRNIHLMVNDPLKYIEIYKDKTDYITFHYEAESIDNIKKIIKNYSHMVNLGLAINPKTNIEQIYEFIPDLSHILIMSVVPGKGGQSFIQNSISKIEKLKKYINKRNLHCFLQVDGGINDKTGPLCFKAGVKNVVSGSFLLNNLKDKNINKKITG